jgi:hypothetical protein
MKILLQLQFNLCKPEFDLQEALDSAIRSQQPKPVTAKQGTRCTATCAEVGCMKPIHYMDTDKTRPMYCKTHMVGKEHRGTKVIDYSRYLKEDETKAGETRR